MTMKLQKTNKILPSVLVLSFSILSHFHLMSTLDIAQLLPHNSVMMANFNFVGGPSLYYHCDQNIPILTKDLKILKKVIFCLSTKPRIVI